MYVSSNAPSVFIILLGCPERSQMFSVTAQPNPSRSLSLLLLGRITFSNDLKATPEVGAYSPVKYGDRPSCSARLMRPSEQSRAEQGKLLVTVLLQKRESRVDLPTPPIPERAIFTVVTGNFSSLFLYSVRLVGGRPFLVIRERGGGDSGSSSKEQVRLSLMEADDLFLDDLTLPLSGFRSLNSMMSSSLRFSEVDSHV